MSYQPTYITRNVKVANVVVVVVVVIIISNLSNDRSKASSKTIPPHSAI